jgi:antitoxin HicB
MLTYALKIEPDTVGYLATCRDLPEFSGAGDTVDETIKNSVEGLETTLSIYIDGGVPVPAPTPAQAGEYSVIVPGVSSAKAELHNARLAAGVSKSELARRMGIPNQIVNRLFDINHKTKWEQLEAGFAALDKRLIVSVSNA